MPFGMLFVGNVLSIKCFQRKGFYSVVQLDNVVVRTSSEWMIGGDERSALSSFRCSLSTKEKCTRKILLFSVIRLVDVTYVSTLLVTVHPQPPEITLESIHLILFAFLIKANLIIFKLKFSCPIDQEIAHSPTDHSFFALIINREELFIRGKQQ